MIFEWDEKKNQENIRKHKLAFEDVKIAFYDEFGLHQIDNRFQYDEERYQLIASIEGFIVVFICYTYRDYNNEEIIRLISARRATKQERLHYENNQTY